MRYSIIIHIPAPKKQIGNVDFLQNRVRDIIESPQVLWDVVKETEYEIKVIAECESREMATMIFNRAKRYPLNIVYVNDGDNMILSKGL